jgi:drug/metabolite transporter (DMT)-like permease
MGLRQRPLFYLLCCGLLLGVTMNLAKLAGELSIPPVTYLFWSIAGAALVQVAVAQWRNPLPPLSKRTLEYYTAAALLGIAGPKLILFAAIPQVGASFIALIMALPPALTYVGALSLGMERFSRWRASGVVAALSGTAILTERQLGIPDAPTGWILIALLGPVLLAMGDIYRTLRWPQGVSPGALSPGVLVCAALILFGASFSTPWPLLAQQPAHWALIAVQAGVFTVQFHLLFKLQKTGGPVFLSLLGATGAVVAVPIAIYLLGESVPSGLLPGSLLIGMGIALLTFSQSKAA